MSEDPQIGLEDAAEFFRQGDDAAKSYQLASSAVIQEIDEDDQPDPEIVELHLRRRARHTRWVVTLMVTLSFGCVVVFGKQWFESARERRAGVELVDDAASSLASPPPKRGGPVQVTYSLHPAEHSSPLPARQVRAAAPALPSPRRAVVPTSAARSTTARRRRRSRATVTRRPRAAAKRPRLSARAASRAPSQAKATDYRPPTARFED